MKNNPAELYLPDYCFYQNVLFRKAPHFSVLPRS